MVESSVWCCVSNIPFEKKCHVLLARKKFGKGKSATAYLEPSENGLSAGHPPIPAGAD